MRFVKLIQEYSIPLITGVVVALLWANIDNETYKNFLDFPILGKDFKVFGHAFNFEFIIADIFMVFFFGVATVEIVEAFLPKGPLNPVSKAINPLMGTFGGIFGPIMVFFLLSSILPIQGLIASLNTGTEVVTMGDFLNGWGVPTATDIALAWLVARMIFGSKHPAISFLLLLAIVDDAIGLGIIAIFYPNPDYPVEPIYLLITLIGMLVALVLRLKKVENIWFYIIIAGTLSWIGLIKTHLHPALALVFIVPFMPTGHHQGHSTVKKFEHTFKGIVDFGLFGFGLASAGVVFAGVNTLTWIILSSLIIGKLIGISFLCYLGYLLGFKLPEGMNFKSICVISIIAGIGLTVSLFVSEEAYINLDLKNASKMGALLSVAAAPLAILLAKVFKIKKIN